MAPASAPQVDAIPSLAPSSSTGDKKLSRSNTTASPLHLKRQSLETKIKRYSSTSTKRPRSVFLARKSFDPSPSTPNMQEIGEITEETVPGGSAFPSLRTIASKFTLRNKASTRFRRQEHKEDSDCGELSREGTNPEVRESLSSDHTSGGSTFWKNITVEVTTVVTSEPAKGDELAQRRSSDGNEDQNGNLSEVPDITSQHVKGEDDATITKVAEAPSVQTTNNDNNNIVCVFEDPRPAPLPSSGLPFPNNLQPWPQLVDELLIETTLAQADSFARKSSVATSIRSPSSVHSPSSSGYGKPRRLRLVSSPAKFRVDSINTSETPTHRPSSSALVHGDKRHRALSTLQKELPSTDLTHQFTLPSLNRSKSFDNLEKAKFLQDSKPQVGRARSSRDLKKESDPTISQLGEQSKDRTNPQATGQNSPVDLVPTTTRRLRLRKRKQPQEVRGAFYFLTPERDWIERTVEKRLREQKENHGNTHCEGHINCVECYHKQYIILESEIMSTSMPPEERQKIINNNRALREIKNNLESLLETGVLSDGAFEAIAHQLPAETSLTAAARAQTSRPLAALPAVSHGAAHPDAFADSPAPPYTSPVPSPTPAALQVGVPPRQPSQQLVHQPAPQPARQPGRPFETARAVALYPYTEAGDCTFEPGDHISIMEYMNEEWWLGRNLRTGAEGVFPRNYASIQSQAHNNDEKNRHIWNQPPPPGPPAQNPYNSTVPPMAIASGSQQPPQDQQQQGQGKVGEMGKKFGKKLGNATIFGAGATIGSNIVNSVF